MTTLEELAQQGDPGTLETEDQARKIKLMDPQQLYELWERQHWASQDVDLSNDRAHWESFTDEERDQMLYNLSAFFIGEERVTTQFSALVMAYEDESEESFLTTQQVDEARHMQFFDRFYREVIGLDEEDISRRLARVRERLNEAFGILFDGSLVESGKTLAADPTDRGAKVDFITTYHMVIEGTLALTGQHFITNFFEQQNVMPGFIDGFGKVARDEHRHVAYGTWYLAQSAGQDDQLARRMQAKLHELIPVAAGVLTPPGYEVGEDYEILGYTSAEVQEFAFKSLTRRLKAIGVPLKPTGEPVAA